jgi:hypothetical protein
MTRRGLLTLTAPISILGYPALTLTVPISTAPEVYYHSSRLPIQYSKTSRLLYRRNRVRLRRFCRLNNKIRFGITNKHYSRSITSESVGAVRFSGDAQDARDTRNTLKQSIRSKTTKSTTAIIINNVDTVL